MPKIIHVVDWRDISRHPDRARLQQAQASWQWLYSNGVTPAHYKDKKRTSDIEIGDERSLPYLKDCLKHGMNAATSPSDIVFWTNDDNWLHPDLVELLRFHVSVYDVCTSRRCEINKMPPENSAPEEFAKLHGGHIGRDLFAATKQWLTDHWSEIPDFILGTSRFDLALAYIVRRYHGFTLQSIQSLDAQAWPAELPIGYVSHVRHVSHWSQNTESPAELHNKRLFEEFVKGLK